MWDWNRKYNPQGELDQENGSPRELHLQQALDCLNMNDVSGKSIEAQCRKTALHEETKEYLKKIFPANDDFQLTVVTFQSKGNLTFEFTNKLAVVTVFDGELQILGRKISKGQSFVVENQEIQIEGHPGLHCGVVVDQSRI